MGHALDEYLGALEPELWKNLRAWRAPTIDYGSPGGIRIMRALARQGSDVCAHFAQNIDEAMRGLPDTRETRRAWTEPIGPWLSGAAANLVRPTSLFFMEFGVLMAPGVDGLNRIDAVALTDELAVMEIRTTIPFGYIPSIFGFVPTRTAAASLALLASRLSTRLWNYQGLVAGNATTDLAAEDFMRVAYAYDLDVDTIFALPADVLRERAKGDFPTLRDRSPIDLRRPPAAHA